jgi:hypothetical protein
MATFYSCRNEFSCEQGKATSGVLRPRKSRRMMVSDRVAVVPGVITMATQEELKLWWTMSVVVYLYTVGLWRLLCALILLFTRWIIRAGGIAL